MLERRSLTTPIVLGLTMIMLLVALIVGWVLLTVFSALREAEHAALYWTLLLVGSVAIGTLILGVVIYLILTIKAVALNRRQVNFIDSVTHELKSPVASLKLCLQTLGRPAVDERERDKFQRLMLEDVDRLNQLIDHLLDAGRLDKRRRDDEDAVELSDVLAECVQTVCLRYRVDPAAVRLDLQQAVVRARRNDLQVMLRNLIDNAVKYAGTPPAVNVVLRAEQDWAVVRISDNGRGIPPEDRRRIFGRFVRLGMELRRDKPGVGLGLHIVRTLVRRLHGRITVGAPEQGSGTVVEVRLPAAEPQQAAAAEEAGRAEVA